MMLFFDKAICTTSDSNDHMSFSIKFSGVQNLITTFSKLVNTRLLLSGNEITEHMHELDWSCSADIILSLNLL